MSAILTDDQLAGFAVRAYTTAPAFHVEDVRACVSACDGATVIAFPGTDPGSLEDWLRDLDAVPVWFSPLASWCHQGFLEGAQKLWPSIHAKLPPGKVVLTGHSLGGALALLVGALMAQGGEHPDAIVTFGAPKVGRGYIRDVILKRVPVLRQYRYGNDPVPDLPGLFFETMAPALIEIGRPEPIDIDAHAVDGYWAATPATPVFGDA